LDGSFRSQALQPLTYLGRGFVPPDLSQDFILAARKLVSRIRNGEGKLLYRVDAHIRDDGDKGHALPEQITACTASCRVTLMTFKMPSGLRGLP
jgi:hypothetical protein